VTLALMSVGTLTIALVPGYETIGLFAPVVVVLGRLCQGFSAGVEPGSRRLERNLSKRRNRKPDYC
jgi:MHS family citrate/tricarballylate:H+ symporter-like MFS transporter